MDRTQESPYEKEIQAMMAKILSKPQPYKPLSVKIAEERAFIYEYTATQGDKADKINSLHKQIH